MKVGLIVEAGDVREVHHVALLVGYGASAINPYLAMETAEQLVRSGMITGITPEKAVKNLIKALGKGVLKIMSKMGISVVGSYAGAQAFEAVGSQPGVRRPVLHRHDQPARRRRHRRDRGRERGASRGRLPARTARSSRTSASQIGGEYQWRREGPPHLFNPETVFRLQHATRARRYDIFRDYTQLVDEQAENLMTLRGLFKLKRRRAPAGADRRGRVDRVDRQALQHRRDELRLDQPGGARDARDRDEPHRRPRRTPARAAKTSSACSTPSAAAAIKQVASGRFGVTSMYLTHATDIQIKMAQGAKPGEGGQLPAGKVYPWIARTRHATAGVGLISPPPHHDIYSIEDLKQLIFDLKRANPEARVHVKLVSPVRHRRGRRGRDEGPGGCRARLRPRRRNRRVARSTRSSTRARRGRSASPRPSRRSCSTACATASSCRSTAR